MKAPVRYWWGRVRYTGRLDRAAFQAWAASSAGRGAIDEVASTIRFAPFGRSGAARRRLWRRLTGAARSTVVAAALQQEIDQYLGRLRTLAHARDLPRAGVDLHRLIAVPRLFVNSEAERRLDAALKSEPAFAGAGAGRRLREWFVLMLIEGIEAAVLAARPSPGRPLAAGRDWIVVGVNDRFEWRVPFTGPAWPGHYYILELTRAPITRAIRKGAGEAISRIETSLTTLSRGHRSEILRRAGLSLEELFARV